MGFVSLPRLDTLGDAENYPTLHHKFSDVPSGTKIIPLGQHQCGTKTDCRGCSYLVQDTEGRIEQLLFGNDPFPIGAICSVGETLQDYRIISLEFPYPPSRRIPSDLIEFGSTRCPRTLGTHL